MIVQRRIVHVVIGMAAGLVGCANTDPAQPVIQYRYSPIQMQPLSMATQPPREFVGPTLPGSSVQQAQATEAIPNPLPTVTPPSVEVQAGQPITLIEALSLVAGRNPRIAAASARYREAYANYESAQVLWLPNINAGVSYNHHDGPLQASNGTIQSVSRSALQSGLGTFATGAGSPVVPGLSAQFDLADAYFNPTIEARTSAAARSGITITTNQTLLDTALAYIEMMRASQDYLIAEETLANSTKLAELTSDFAEAGEGPQSDADRSKAEESRARNALTQARERREVASIRLVELLRLDPGVRLIPQEGSLIPLDILPVEAVTSDMVVTALSNRPELAESADLVAAARERMQREKYGPFIPSVILGVSQSGFGGGRRGTIGNTDGRFDLDMGVYWQLENLGFGTRARQNRSRAGLDRMMAEQVQVMDRVARQVNEAGTQVQARRPQIEVAQEGITYAEAAVKRDFERIKEGEGLPIEALQSIRLLAEARREYLRAVAEYDQAQFQLQWALGWSFQ